jgi:hypothetical protein
VKSFFSYIGRVMSEKDGTPSSLRWAMVVIIVTICGVVIHAEATHTDLSANLRDILIWLGGIAFGSKVGSKPFENVSQPSNQS